MKEKLNSTAYNLGIFIGEYIVMRYLPQLSCYSDSFNAIQITWGEYKEYNRLNDIWYNEYSKNNKCSHDNFNKLLTYEHDLKLKYLPHKLDCYLTYHIDLTEIDEIKNGIIESLWNSDICDYLLEPENINIYNSKFSTIVNLKLDKNLNLQQSHENKNN